MELSDAGIIAQHGEGQWFIGVSLDVAAKLLGEHRLPVAFQWAATEARPESSPLRLGGGGEEDHPATARPARGTRGLAKHARRGDGVEELSVLPDIAVKDRSPARVVAIAGTTGVIGWTDLGRFHGRRSRLGFMAVTFNNRG
jgi:hypothetical protein